MKLAYMYHRPYCKICNNHGKIILIKGNAKCRLIKKMTCKGTLRQVFICLWTRTYTPHLHTVFGCNGGGGTVEPERRLEGQWFTRLGPKYTYRKVPFHVNLFR